MTLDELKKLHEAATPGPWTCVEFEFGDYPSVAFVVTAPDGMSGSVANASIIPAMRNALPDLIAAVELLRKAWVTEADEAEKYAILKRLGVE